MKKANSKVGSEFHRALFRASVRVALFLMLPGVMRAADQPCSSVEGCARYSIAHKQFDQAIRLLNRQLTRSPRDLEALNLLGIALTGKGRLDEADREYQRAIEIDPHFQPALTNLAANKLAEGHVSEAKEHLEQALRYAPTDESANLLLGEIELGEEQYALAAQHYAKAGKRLDGAAAGVIHYAECEIRLKRFEQAASILSRLPPKDGEDHFRAGALLAEQGAYREAAQEFGLARVAYKDPYLAGYNQTLAYLKAANYPAAIDIANQLLNQGRATAELANLAGAAYLQNGQVNEACNALRLAAHLDPKNEDSYVDLCAICLDHQSYELGLEIADIGLSHLPDSERLHLERGLLRVMKGQFTEAQDDFLRAARVAPQGVLPGVALGLIAMQMGRLDRAVEILRGAAKAHPDSYLAQYWYGRALMQSGAAPGTEEALEAAAAFEACIRLNPSFWHARLDLSKILLDSGAVDSAIRQLEEAVALNPGSGGPLYMLSQAYRRKGDQTRARDLALRASKLKSEDDDAFPGNTLRRIVREGTSALPSGSTGSATR